MKRAVVVFSGGQDSTTCLIQALNQYDEVHYVNFDYSQRHRAEITIAHELAMQLGARAYKVIDAGLLNALAVSSFTRDNIPVPGYEDTPDGLPSTFVAGRNILFLKLWPPSTPIRSRRTRSSPACARRISPVIPIAATTLSKR